MRAKDNLKKPTVADKLNCYEMVKERVYPDGSKETTGMMRSLYEWARVGLDCTIEDLEQFTQDEIIEIAGKVITLANVNPQKG